MFGGTLKGRPKIVYVSIYISSRNWVNYFKLLSGLNNRVASGYFFLGSILIRGNVHTDREKVSTKTSYYTDKPLK